MSRVEDSVGEVELAETIHKLRGTGADIVLRRLGFERDQFVAKIVALSDEIERLRAALQDAQADRMRGNCKMMADGCECGLCKRDREIDRLRTVLRDIARGDPFHEHPDSTGFAVFDYAAYRIAAKRAIEAAKAAGGGE